MKDQKIFVAIEIIFLFGKKKRTVCTFLPLFLRFFRFHEYHTSMRFQLNTDTVICKLASAAFASQSAVYEVSSYYKRIYINVSR